MKKLLCLILAVVCLFSFCACGAANTDKPEKVNITVGTGSTTGTYYAYTQAVASILADKTGYSLNVVSTGGSVANLKGVDLGDYKMAIVQNDTMINAYNALDEKNFTKAITSFSVLGEVYSEVVQIVVDGKLKNTVKTLADLKGYRVSIGDIGSGVEKNAIELFAAYGIDVEKDITKQNLSVNKSADAMKDGNLDAFFFTSGAPATAITELAMSKDVYLLSLGDTVMADFIANHKIDGKYDVYSVMEITNKQYSCIATDSPVKTIGVTATFIVSNELSEEVVYNMTKALWESTDAIGNAHAVGKTMNVNAATITLGNVPVHPGAAKYYAELAK